MLYGKASYWLTACMPGEDLEENEHHERCSQQTEPESRSSVDAHPTAPKGSETAKQAVCLGWKTERAQFRPAFSALLPGGSALQVGKFQMGAHFRQPTSPKALAAFLLERGA